MVLVSIPVCLLSLSILVASSPYLTISGLIVFCIYLLVRCLLSDMSSIIFSVVIMLSPLIYRMLIYIFLLLSITVVFYYLFGTICHISRRFYLLGQQPQRLSQPSINIYCSFAVTRVSVLLSIWMTSWSWFALSRQVSGLAHFCVPYWFTLDYILNFLGLTFALLRLLGLCWDTVHMSVSLPPDKLADIQQLALSLLQTQPFMVHQVMIFLGKANFCANGHSQLWRLCHVIQSDILTVYHSPTHLFSPVQFPFQLYINWNRYLICNRFQFLCSFHFLM